MKFTSRTLLSVLALAASVSLAQAQTQQDHQTHNSAGQGAPQGVPSTSSAQPQGSMQGMMDQGDRMRMMQDMMAQRGEQPNADAMPCPMMANGRMGMPFERIEGRIAFLKAELNITDAQAKEWSAFADALRANAAVHRSMHEQMVKDEKPASLTERFDRREKMLSSRLEAVTKLNAAAKPLFASLSEEQRKIADELLGGALGMM